MLSSLEEHLGECAERRHRHDFPVWLLRQGDVHLHHFMARASACVCNCDLHVYSGIVGVEDKTTVIEGCVAQTKAKTIRWLDQSPIKVAIRAADACGHIEV